MDDRAREILHQTRETLARVADVVVEHRNHEDDGFLTAWSRGMPRKPTPPTMAEVEQKIAAVLAKQPRALTADDLAGYTHTLVENIAETFASRKQIKQLREEISQLRADLTTA
jgi:hypothetical protein